MKWRPCLILSVVLILILPMFHLSLPSRIVDNSSGTRDIMHALYSEPSTYKETGFIEPSSLNGVYDAVNSSRTNVSFYDRIPRDDHFRSTFNQYYTGRRITRRYNGYIYYPTPPIDMIPSKAGVRNNDWLKAVELKEETYSSVMSLPEIIPKPIDTQGIIRIPAILIEFQDVKFESGHDVNYYSNFLNNEYEPSLRTYYLENSYGNLTIIVDVYGVVVSDYDLSYYGADGTYIDDANGPIYELAREAILKADPLIDYSMYDNNNDGYVDAVLIIHAGTGQEWSYNSTDIWSHRWSIFTNPPFLDGVYVMDYTMQPEHYPPKENYPLGASLLGVFCHEFGHILGLPDLYDVDHTSSGIGDWGLMGSGGWTGVERPGDNPSHLCAWSKAFLGFINPIPLNPELIGLNELQPVETSGQVIKLPIPGHVGEYFLIEYRSRNSGALFDKAIPGSGLLIWHVDENVAYMDWDNDSINNWDDNDVNTNESHFMVDLEEFDNYDGTQELELGTNRGESTDTWSNIEIGFWDYTNPSSRAYDGTPSGFGIYAISTPKETISFKIQAETIEIRDEIRYESKTIYINSNVTIAPNGILDIENSTVLINSSYDNEFNIYVKGGELILRNTVLEPVNQYNGYEIKVTENSTIIWINTSILYTDYDSWHAYQIYIDTNNAVQINNVTIAYGSNFYMNNINNARVENISWISIDYVYIYNAKNVTFSGISMRYKYGSITFVSCSNITIKDSYFDTILHISSCKYTVLSNAHIEISGSPIAGGGDIRGLYSIHQGSIYLWYSENITIRNSSLIGGGLTVVGDEISFTTLNIDDLEVNNKPFLLISAEDEVLISNATYGEVLIGYVNNTRLRNLNTDFIEIYYSRNLVILENISLSSSSSYIDILYSLNVNVSNIIKKGSNLAISVSSVKNFLIKDGSFSWVTLENASGILLNNTITGTIRACCLSQASTFIGNIMDVSYIYQYSSTVKYLNNTFVNTYYIYLELRYANATFIGNNFSLADGRSIQISLYTSSSIVFMGNILNSTQISFNYFNGVATFNYNYYRDLNTYMDLNDDLIVDSEVIIDETLGIIDTNPLSEIPIYVGGEIVCALKHDITSNYEALFNIRPIGSNITSVRIRYEWKQSIYLNEAEYDPISDTYRLSLPLNQMGLLRYWIIVDTPSQSLYIGPYTIEIPDLNAPKIQLMYYPSNPVEGDDLHVIAIIDDESYVSRVLLSYRMSKDWIRMTMIFNEEENYYEATINNLLEGSLFMRVYAEDVYGNGKWSDLIIVTVNSKSKDSSAPLIYVTYSPTELHEGEELTVYATISTENELESVLLYYTYGESWNKLAMNYDTYLNCYVAKIGNLSAGLLMLRVYAEDIYGNEAESELITINVKLLDESPPLITVFYEPEQPKIGDNLTILAFIDDESPIINVTLLYYNGSNWISVNMNYSSGLGFWIYKLTNLKINKLFFRVIAIDAYGNEAISQIFIIELSPSASGNTTNYFTILAITTILLGSVSAAILLKKYAIK